MDEPQMTNAAPETPGIGSRLRAARERLGWTREALAFHSGISWPAIAQVESGRRTNVRPSTLAALSRPLGVTIDYLVNGGPSHAPMLRHSAFRYAADEEFQTAMGSFLAEGVERSEGVIAMTTGPNIELLRAHLRKDARHVTFVESKDWLTTPAGALEEFRSVCDAKIEAGAPWVRFLAEPVWEGRSKPEVRVWIRYESLLNLLFGSYPLALVCPYDERSVPAEILSQVELTHPETIGADGPSKSPDYRGPGRLALDP
jgi:transcriptional regulator with XRE-family HTH domain